MRRFASILAILFCILPATGQKKPFAIEDLYRLKSVADVQISPDGKSIAFQVSEPVLAEGRSLSDIDVMNTDGRNLRAVSGERKGNSHPRWSPDGHSLLFLSSRSNGPQIWRVNPDGGSPEQITNISTGAGDAEWTPDGSRIVFTSDVFPECGADDRCNADNDSTMSKGPIQAHMADRLLYRHWDSWKDGKRTHTFVLDPASRSVTDLTPGDFDAPAWMQGGRGFAISPDGKEICIVSNHDRNEAETTNKDLWIVPIAGGEARNITAPNPAYDGDPAYSPDGRYIAYRLQKIPRYESDRFRIGLFDRSSGRHSILTEAFDNWIGDFSWSADSRSIYFTADVGGHVPLYLLDVSTRKIRQVIDLKTINAYAISPDGKTVFAVRRSVGEPPEIWSATTEGKESRPLTFLNKELSETVDIRPAEEIWIPSSTGKKIHTFIVKPHNFDPKKKYPLILNVHGGPQSQWADAFRGDWQVYPGSGYVVAFPNPHGSTGYGQDFTAEISGDFGGKVYDDVMSVADSLARIPWVDANRMGAMGWSYGGYMMMWLEGHTARFKAIASMMGLYNLTGFHGGTEELWFPQWDLGGTPWDSDLYMKWSPNQFVRNFKTPCLVITGERDYRVPYTQSLEFFTDLQKMEVPSRLIVFPNDGHWPHAVRSMPIYYNAHLDWFHRYLGGDPAPYDMLKMVRNQAFIVK